MARKKTDYTLLSRWRNGWQLILNPKTGQHFLRRAFQGSHKVNVTKNGYTWRITDPENGEVLNPSAWRGGPSRNACRRGGERTAFLKSLG